MNAYRRNGGKFASQQATTNNESRSDKTKDAYANCTRDLHVETTSTSFRSDQKMPARPILKKAAVETGPKSGDGKTIATRRIRQTFDRAQSHSDTQGSGTKKKLGVQVQSSRKQNAALMEPTVEKLQERQTAVSRLLGVQEPSGMAARRTVRRVRRERSERTLETTFSEISGDDLTVESSMACLYAESENVVVEEEINYDTGTKRGCSQIPPVVQVESRELNKNTSETQKSRRRRRSKSIGTVSVSVNITPHPDMAQGSHRSRRSSISNITVEVSFDERNGRSYTVNTKQSSTARSMPNIDKQETKAVSENTGVATTTSTVPFDKMSSIVPVGWTDKRQQKSDHQAMEIDESDSEGDYNCSESTDGTSISPEQMTAASLDPVAANVSVHIHAVDGSGSADGDAIEDIDSESESTQHDLVGVDERLYQANARPFSTTARVPECMDIVPFPSSLDPAPEVSLHAKPDMIPSQHADESYSGPALSHMSRAGLVNLFHANGATDHNVYANHTRAIASPIERSTRTTDPLSSSQHMFRGEATETVEAYETAVSMQNIGLHNRYGFMVDDREVKRSSLRKRSSLSFNTSASDFQELSHVQMRNHCEPTMKRNPESKFPPSASNTFQLSSHSTRSVGLHGSRRSGQRPIMQKSMSTRSFSKRSFLNNRRPSLHSINQSQTIAENAEMIDETPYVQQTSNELQDPNTPISDMTVMYRRRSSKSLFSDNDEDLSVSDMGSVMSFDRDDESNSAISVGTTSLVSGRTGRSWAGSKKSLGLSTRKSKGFRVGKLIKKMSLRRRGSDESLNTAKSTMSNFFSKMLAKRGSKKHIEPWQTLDITSPCYWADYRVDSSSVRPEKEATHYVASTQRIKRRASM